MNRTRPTTRTGVQAGPRRGFTLIELLAVIVISLLLLGISFPTLRALVRTNSIDMAVGQINSGVAAARVYATRDRPFLTARRVGASVRTSSANGDGYSGAICLFTPAGSLRVLQNDENAQDPRLGRNPWLETQAPPLNGYRSIPELDDIRLPGRVQCLGVVRTGPGAYDVQLVPPPFAIRFSDDGTLSLGDRVPPSLGLDPDFRYAFVSPKETVVIPAGTGNSNLLTDSLDYELGNNRTTNPSESLDEEAFGRGGDQRTSTGRIHLPFGAIETVLGVLVVDPDLVPERFAHPDAGVSPSVAATNHRRDRLAVYSEQESARILNWARDSSGGRLMLFNRSTGQDLTR